MHVHEGQAGDQPHADDVVEDENNDCDVRVNDDKNDDAPYLHFDESHQAVDQSSDIIDGNNNDNDNADIVEDDNNDGDGAMPLLSMISPNLTQMTPTRYWVSPHQRYWTADQECVPFSCKVAPPW